ncbi:MalM family protein [Marinobacter sp. F4218]|uniref:MalM family protein n=1 Tax=Marinobacter sp. F4218 TaxID=2862868 RepID=UPI001C63255E|nr:MalM family protein [Marinobacter sp. F4218]MBW7470200.1 hypothetical protein [Marinobacter sp. F4218]
MTIHALVKAAVVATIAGLVVGCQVGGAPVSEREGYFTWVDEQGRVRYSPIVKTPAEGAGGEVESAGTPPETKSGSAGSDGRKMSQTLEEETEYTLENYPDATQLAKDGYVRPGERQPYFTWRDAEGNVRVSYFQPDTRSEAEKGRIPPPIELTPASIYHAGPDIEPEVPVAGSDPDAFAVLGIESRNDDYFARFREFCCRGLDTSNHEEWQRGREFGVDITSQSPVHNFLTGTSPFQLIALAGVADRSDFIVRIRSYDQDGVFVPSLVFLDGEFEPVRLVTDLVSSYEPETWSRRGFLEAWVPVFPAEGERWLVLFTRNEDLQGQTVIETGKGPKAIPHVAHGEIGLMMAEQE